MQSAARRARTRGNTGRFWLAQILLICCMGGLARKEYRAMGTHPNIAAPGGAAFRLRAQERHYELASAGILAPEQHRILLSVFVGSLEADGDADILLSIRRDRSTVGEFALVSVGGPTGCARWGISQMAFSVIDFLPPPGPQVYLLAADVRHGEAVMRDIQIWPSIVAD
jgi:hypothetical protein